MEIKIKLYKDGVVPKKATDGSAAYDLIVNRPTIIRPGRQVVPLAFSIEMENGYEAQLEPRSGFSSKGMEGFDMYIKDEYNGVYYFTRKKHLFGLFTTYDPDPRRYDADVLTGKIDSDYRGICGVIIKSSEKKEFVIAEGTHIAQLTIRKVENDVEWVKTDILSRTGRGHGGFGHSTDKDKKK